MTPNMAPTPIIQNSIPVRYDSRVVVNPCEPDRVPFLPVDILYQIAKALPQPKQVFHLALASKDVWEYLQPALYECEVTYEARLAHKYGGQSSVSAEERYASFLDGGDDYDDDYSSNDDYSSYDRALDWGNQSDSVRESESEEDTASAGEPSRENEERNCDSDNGDECDNERINLEKSRFKFEMPRMDEQFRVVGAMTALHWASIHGTSALPVAQKAIRAALTHQPSYINGLNLVKRCYKRCYTTHDPDVPDNIFADHPPPLFLAVAHGNLELFQVLIHAGADVHLLVGRTNRVDDRGTLICSKIHQQCVVDKYAGMDQRCFFEIQMDSEENPGYDFPACQTIGHVALQYGQTEMLQLLLQNGLDIQRGSRHLLHSAVLHGNLAAVKALLAHDPSSVHSRYQDVTPMHLVPFMENAAGIAVPEELLKSIVSCLLGHGASLEATRNLENYDLSSAYSSDGYTPLDSAFKRLKRAQLKSGGEYHIITALRAASLFLNLGSSWLPPLSVDGSAVPLQSEKRQYILNTCLEKTVLLVESKYDEDDDLWNSDFDSIRYRSIRKLWGQTCKTLIRQASEALSRGAHSVNKEDVQEMLHHAFRHLTYRADGRWQREGIIGWWAVEALGNLLLSTGIKPCDIAMSAWKRILKRDYGVPDKNVKPIKECGEMDGDKSEWAFLLEGITFANVEAAFPPAKHRHLKY